MNSSQSLPPPPKGNLANELMAEYYAARADCGLIITEGLHISKQAVGAITPIYLFYIKYIPSLT